VLYVTVTLLLQKVYANNFWVIAIFVYSAIDVILPQFHGKVQIGFLKFREWIYTIHISVHTRARARTHRVESCYTDIGLYNTSPIASDILRYQLIRHC
jgi:hypothetical protein